MSGISITKSYSQSTEQAAVNNSAASSQVAVESYFTRNSAEDTITTPHKVRAQAGHFDGAVAFYGGVGEDAPTPAVSLLNLSDIDSSLATAAVGSPLVKLANGKWGPGSVSIDLTNYFTKEESDARFAFKSHSHDYVAPSAFNAHTGDTTKHITSAERVAWSAKESALGNPDVDGKILASTAGGVRSWVNRYVLPVAAAAMLGGVMIGANINVDAQGRISVAAPYSHPATHPASMIDESATRRFLTDAERANWNDSYDKRHTHGNKANLDSINQNLSQTSNVKFNDVIADGSVGFYGGVGSGSTPVASLLDLSDIDASISTAATGTPLVKLANGKWGAGSISIDLSNYYNKSDADARYAFKSHSHDYVTTSVFNGHTHAYLPLAGKAADSDLLDGIDGSWFIFGDNASGTSHISENNINGYIKSGFYTVNLVDNTKLPAGASAVSFLLRNSYYGVGNMAGNEFLSFDNNNSPLYFRTGTGSGKGNWRIIWDGSNLLNIGTTASSARTALELTGTVTSHNHIGTYALISGATTQDFSAKNLTLAGNLNYSSSLDFGIQYGGTNYVRVSSGGQLILSSNSAVMYFRPNGNSNTTDQMTLNTSGVLSVNSLALNGALSGATEINAQTFQLPYNVVSTLWGSSTGGALQLLSDASTATRWVRVGMVGYDKSWWVGMTITGAGEATFSSSVSATSFTSGGNAVIHSGNIGSQSVNYAVYSGYMSQTSLNEDTLVANQEARTWHNWAQYSTSMGNYNYGLHIGSPDPNYKFQLVGVAGNSNLYLRIKNITYSSWQKIWTDGNLTNTLSNGYLPYWNGSSLVNSAIYNDTDRVNITGKSIKLYSLQYAGNDYRYVGTEYNNGNGNNRAEIRFAIDGIDTFTRVTIHTANGAGTIYERLRVSYNGNVDIGFAGSRGEKCAVNGSVYAASYIESASYLKGTSVKLGTWEIKENASGELEFIQSGVLKFKGTSAGLISQGEVGFYS